jgi:hypothetical protein
MSAKGQSTFETSEPLTDAVPVYDDVAGGIAESATSGSAEFVRLIGSQPRQWTSVHFTKEFSSTGYQRSERFAIS